VRRYANLADDARDAITRFAADVRRGRFPASDETYHAADNVADVMIAVYGGDDPSAEPTATAADGVEAPHPA
jgi:hypothetical protein